MGVKAVAYFEAHHVLAISLKLAHVQSHAALNMGVALTLRVRAARQGGSLVMGLHKDICGVLSKWREVVKDGVSPDSCTAGLVAFLQR